MSGDPLKSVVWRMQCAQWTEIPNLNTLNACALSANLKPGIYTLVDASNRRAFLTVYSDGSEPCVSGLDTDPEYLGRGTGLPYRGEIKIP